MFYFLVMDGDDEQVWIFHPFSGLMKEFSIWCKF